jgi:endonuclease/exonuclease/phosphatase family metal-dependent hydrolase
MMTNLLPAFTACTGISGTGRFLPGKALVLVMSLALLSSCGTSEEAGKTTTVPGSGGSAGDCLRTTDAGCVQLATFNMEFFAMDNAAAKLVGLKGAIEDSGLDLVVLQEVESGSDLSQFIDEYLAGSSVWGYEISSSGGVQKIAFLYKKAMFSVSNTAEMDNGSSGGAINESDSQWSGLRLPLYAQVTTIPAGYSFGLLGLHLKAHESGDVSGTCQKRKDQIADIADLIGNLDEQLIIAGDLNDTLSGFGLCEDVSIDTLSELESSMTFLTDGDASAVYMPAGLFTNINFTSIIDHIVHRGMTSRLVQQPSNYWVSVVSHGNTTISDHQPAVIWLENTEE